MEALLKRNTVKAQLRNIKSFMTTKTALRHRQFVTLCGRIFRDTDSAYFPYAEYHGRTLLFCTEACLGAFLADPDVFYNVHRNSEKGKGYGSHKLASESADGELTDPL